MPVNDVLNSYVNFSDSRFFMAYDKGGGNVSSVAYIKASKRYVFWPMKHPK